MAIQIDVQRYQPRQVEQPYGQLLETQDFPRSDPWSWKMRQVLAERATVFSGKPLIEGGIGDARNELEIYDALHGVGFSRPTSIIGIDIETWRLDFAAHNLEQTDMPYELIYGGAYQWLAQLPEKQIIEGNAIFCLPQAPLLIGESVADGYDARYIPDYAHPWDTYGLGLNFAVLTELGKRATTDFTAFTMLNTRIPEEALDAMVAAAGWRIVAKHSTEPLPVQQDPDTDITYTIQHDDGQRFYELTKSGTYEAISALEAEKRRKACLASGGGRAELNVYHHLIVYELQPAKIVN